MIIFKIHSISSTTFRKHPDQKSLYNNYYEWVEPTSNNNQMTIFNLLKHCTIIIIFVIKALTVQLQPD